jgi:NAD(P)H-dependent FMN reductase
MSEKKAYEKLKIVGICGSLRDGSNTRMALTVALRGAEETGANTQLIDLRDYRLTFCDGREDAKTYAGDVMRLREEVGAAQGILLATPEYHGGYSGVLKNALDLMGFDEFEGKMLGLVGVSGGAMGAFSALNDLRNIGRALHAWVVPTQASVPKAWSVFDADGKLKDKDIEKRLKNVGREVAKFACVHKAASAKEFLKLWQDAPENPGGET